MDSEVMSDNPPQLQDDTAMPEEILESTLSRIWISLSSFSGVFWNALCWQLNPLIRLYYVIVTSVDGSRGKQRKLICWLEALSGREVLNLQAVWEDGSIVCDVINAVMVGNCEQKDHHGNCLRHAQELAYHHFKLLPVFSNSELQKPFSPSLEKRLWRYLLSLRNALKLRVANNIADQDEKDPEYLIAEEYVARGMGLILASQGERAIFYIYSRDDSSLADIHIHIKGPNGECGEATAGEPIDSENHSIEIDYRLTPDYLKVCYIPNILGHHELSLTRYGFNIPGSPFIIKVGEHTGPPSEKFTYLEWLTEDQEEERRLEVERKRNLKVVSRVIDLITEKMHMTHDGILVKMDESSLQAPSPPPYNLKRTGRSLSPRPRCKLSSQNRSKSLTNQKLIQAAEFLKFSSCKEEKKLVQDAASQVSGDFSMIHPVGIDQFQEKCQRIVIACDFLLSHAPKQKSLEILTTAEKILDIPYNSTLTHHKSSFELYRPHIENNIEDGTLDRNKHNATTESSQSSETDDEKEVIKPITPEINVTRVDFSDRLYSMRKSDDVGLNAVSSFNSDSPTNENISTPHLNEEKEKSRSMSPQKDARMARKSFKTVGYTKTKRPSQTSLSINDVSDELYHSGNEKDDENRQNHDLTEGDQNVPVVHANELPEKSTEEMMNVEHFSKRSSRSREPKITRNSKHAKKVSNLVKKFENQSVRSNVSSVEDESLLPRDVGNDVVGNCVENNMKSFIENDELIENNFKTMEKSLATLISDGQGIRSNKIDNVLIQNTCETTENISEAKILNESESMLDKINDSSQNTCERLEKTIESNICDEKTLDDINKVTNDSETNIISARMISEVDRNEDSDSNIKVDISIQDCGKDSKRIENSNSNSTLRDEQDALLGCTLQKVVEVDNRGQKSLEESFLKSEIPVTSSIKSRVSAFEDYCRKNATDSELDMKLKKVCHFEKGAGSTGDNKVDDHGEYTAKIKSELLEDIEPNGLVMHPNNQSMRKFKGIEEDKKLENEILSNHNSVKEVENKDNNMEEDKKVENGKHSEIIGETLNSNVIREVESPDYQEECELNSKIQDENSLENPTKEYSTTVDDSNGDCVLLAVKPLSFDHNSNDSESSSRTNRFDEEECVNEEEKHPKIDENISQTETDAVEESLTGEYEVVLALNDEYLSSKIPAENTLEFPENLIGENHTENDELEALKISAIIDEDPKPSLEKQIDDVIVNTKDKSMEINYETSVTICDSGILNQEGDLSLSESECKDENDFLLENTSNGKDCLNEFLGDNRETSGSLIMKDAGSDMSFSESGIKEEMIKKDLEDDKENSDKQKINDAESNMTFSETGMKEETESISSVSNDIHEITMNENLNLEKSDENVIEGSENFKMNIPGKDEFENTSEKIYSVTEKVCEVNSADETLENQVLLECDNTIISHKSDSSVNLITNEKELKEEKHDFINTKIDDTLAENYNETLGAGVDHDDTLNKTSTIVMNHDSQNIEINRNMDDESIEVNLNITSNSDLLKDVYSSPTNETEDEEQKKMILNENVNSNKEEIKHNDSTVQSLEDSVIIHVKVDDNDGALIVDIDKDLLSSNEKSSTYSKVDNNAVENMKEHDNSDCLGEGEVKSDDIIAMTDQNTSELSFDNLHEIKKDKSETNMSEENKINNICHEMEKNTLDDSSDHVRSTTNGIETNSKDLIAEKYQNSHQSFVEDTTLEDDRRLIYPTGINESNKNEIFVESDAADKNLVTVEGSRKNNLLLETLASSVDEINIAKKIEPAGEDTLDIHDSNKNISNLVKEVEAVDLIKTTSFEDCLSNAVEDSKPAEQELVTNVEKSIEEVDCYQEPIIPTDHIKSESGMDFLITSVKEAVTDEAEVDTVQENLGTGNEGKLMSGNRDDFSNKMNQSDGPVTTVKAEENLVENNIIVTTQFSETSNSNKEVLKEVFDEHEAILFEAEKDGEDLVDGTDDTGNCQGTQNQEGSCSNVEESNKSEQFTYPIEDEYPQLSDKESLEERENRTGEASENEYTEGKLELENACNKKIHETSTETDVTKFNDKDMAVRNSKCEDNEFVDTGKTSPSIAEIPSHTIESALNDLNIHGEEIQFDKSSQHIEAGNVIENCGDSQKIDCCMMKNDEFLVISEGSLLKLDAVPKFAGPSTEVSSNAIEENIIYHSSKQAIDTEDHIPKIFELDNNDSATKNIIKDNPETIFSQTACDINDTTELGISHKTEFIFENEISREYLDNDKSGIFEDEIGVHLGNGKELAKKHVEECAVEKKEEEYIHGDCKVFEPAVEAKKYSAKEESNTLHIIASSGSEIIEGGTSKNGEVDSEIIENKVEGDNETETIVREDITQKDYDETLLKSTVLTETFDNNRETRTIEDMNRQNSWDESGEKFRFIPATIRIEQEPQEDISEQVVDVENKREPGEEILIAEVRCEARETEQCMEQNELEKKVENMESFVIDNVKASMILEGNAGNSDSKITDKAKNEYENNRMIENSCEIQIMKENGSQLEIDSSTAKECHENSKENSEPSQLDKFYVFDNMNVDTLASDVNSHTQNFDKIDNDELLVETNKEEINDKTNNELASDIVADSVEIIVTEVSNITSCSEDTNEIQIKNSNSEQISPSVIEDVEHKNDLLEETAQFIDENMKIEEDETIFISTKENIEETSTKSKENTRKAFSTISSEIQPLSQEKDVKMYDSSTYDELDLKSEVVGLHKGDDKDINQIYLICTDEKAPENVDKMDCKQISGEDNLEKDFAGESQILDIDTVSELISNNDLNNSIITLEPSSPKLLGKLDSELLKNKASQAFLDSEPEKMEPIVTAENFINIEDERNICERSRINNLQENITLELSASDLQSCSRFEPEKSLYMPPELEMSSETSTISSSKILDVDEILDKERTEELPLLNENDPSENFQEKQKTPLNNITENITKIHDENINGKSIIDESITMVSNKESSESICVNQQEECFNIPKNKQTAATNSEIVNQENFDTEVSSLTILNEDDLENKCYIPDNTFPEEVELETNKNIENDKECELSTNKIYKNWLDEETICDQNISGANEKIEGSNGVTGEQNYIGSSNVPISIYSESSCNDDLQNNTEEKSMNGRIENYGVESLLKVGLEPSGLMTFDMTSTSDEKMQIENLLDFKPEELKTSGVEIFSNELIPSGENYDLIESSQSNEGLFDKELIDDDLTISLDGVNTNYFNINEKQFEINKNESVDQVKVSDETIIDINKFNQDLPAEEEKVEPITFNETSTNDLIKIEQIASAEIDVLLSISKDEILTDLQTTDKDAVLLSSDEVITNYDRVNINIEEVEITEGNETVITKEEIGEPTLSYNMSTSVIDSTMNMDSPIATNSAGLPRDCKHEKMTEQNNCFEINNIMVEDPSTNESSLLENNLIETNKTVIQEDESQLGMFENQPDENDVSEIHEIDANELGKEVINTIMGSDKQIEEEMKIEHSRVEEKDENLKLIYINDDSIPVQNKPDASDETTVNSSLKVECIENESLSTFQLSELSLGRQETFLLVNKSKIDSRSGGKKSGVRGLIEKFSNSEITATCDENESILELGIVMCDPLSEKGKVVTFHEAEESGPDQNNKLSKLIEHFESNMTGEGQHNVLTTDENVEVFPLDYENTNKAGNEMIDNIVSLSYEPHYSVPTNIPSIFTDVTSDEKNHDESFPPQHEFDLCSIGSNDDEVVCKSYTDINDGGNESLTKNENFGSTEHLLLCIEGIRDLRDCDIESSVTDEEEKILCEAMSNETKNLEIINQEDKTVNLSYEKQSSAIESIETQNHKIDHNASGIDSINMETSREIMKRYETSNDLMADLIVEKDLIKIETTVEEKSLQLLVQEDEFINSNKEDIVDVDSKTKDKEIIEDEKSKLKTHRIDLKESTNIEEILSQNICVAQNDSLIIEKQSDLPHNSNVESQETHMEGSTEFTFTLPSPVGSHHTENDSLLNETNENPQSRDVCYEILNELLNVESKTEEDSLLKTSISDKQGTDSTGSELNRSISLIVNSSIESDYNFCNNLDDTGAQISECVLEVLMSNNEQLESVEEPERDSIEDIFLTEAGEACAELDENQVNEELSWLNKQSELEESPSLSSLWPSSTVFGPSSEMNLTTELSEDIDFDSIISAPSLDEALKKFEKRLSDKMSKEPSSKIEQSNESVILEANQVVHGTTCDTSVVGEQEINTKNSQNVSNFNSDIDLLSENVVNNDSQITSNIETLHGNDSINTQNESNLNSKIDLLLENIEGSITQNIETSDDNELMTQMVNQFSNNYASSENDQGFISQTNNDEKSAYLISHQESSPTIDMHETIEYPLLNDENIEDRPQPLIKYCEPCADTDKDRPQQLIKYCEPCADTDKDRPQPLIKYCDPCADTDKDRPQPLIKYCEPCADTDKDRPQPLIKYCEPCADTDKDRPQPLIKYCEPCANTDKDRLQPLIKYCEPCADTDKTLFSSLSNYNSSRPSSRMEMIREEAEEMSDNQVGEEIKQIGEERFAPLLDTGSDDVSVSDISECLEKFDSLIQEAELYDKDLFEIDENRLIQISVTDCDSEEHCGLPIESEIPECDRMISESTSSIIINNDFESDHQLSHDSQLNRINLDISNIDNIVDIDGVHGIVYCRIDSPHGKSTASNLKDDSTINCVKNSENSNKVNRDVFMGKEEVSTTISDDSCRKQEGKPRKSLVKSKKMFWDEKLKTLQTEQENKSKLLIEKGIRKVSKYNYNNIIVDIKPTPKMNQSVNQQCNGENLLDRTNKNFASSKQIGSHSNNNLSSNRTSTVEEPIKIVVDFSAENSDEVFEDQKSVDNWKHYWNNLMNEKDDVQIMRRQPSIRVQGIVACSKTLFEKSTNSLERSVSCEILTDKGEWGNKKQIPARSVGENLNRIGLGTLETPHKFREGSSGVDEEHSEISQKSESVSSIISERIKFFERSSNVSKPEARCQTNNIEIAMNLRNKKKCSIENDSTPCSPTTIKIDYFDNNEESLPHQLLKNNIKMYSESIDSSDGDMYNPLTMTSSGRIRSFSTGKIEEAPDDSSSNIEEDKLVNMGNNHCLEKSDSLCEESKQMCGLEPMLLCRAKSEGNLSMNKRITSRARFEQAKSFFKCLEKENQGTKNVRDDCVAILQKPTRSKQMSMDSDSCGEGCKTKKKESKYRRRGRRRRRDYTMKVRSAPTSDSECRMSMYDSEFGGSERHRSKRVSERFHVKHLFRDISGDSDGIFKGIPNRKAVLASLEDLRADSVPDEQEDCDEPTRSHSLSSIPSGYQDEYPYLPLTPPSQYRHRSHLEDRFISRCKLVTYEMEI